MFRLSQEIFKIIQKLHKYFGVFLLFFLLDKEGESVGKLNTAVLFTIVLI